MTSRLPACLSSAVACMFVLLATYASAQGRGSETGEAVQRQQDSEAYRLAVQRYAEVVLEAQRQGPPPGTQPGGRGGARSGGPSPTTAPLPSDPLSGPVVTNAPYSGDAVTTVTQILGDGTRIENRTDARFYRDSAGRVRREQTILGLAALNPGAQAQTIVTIGTTPTGVPTLLNGQPMTVVYTLDPVARTARRGAAPSGFTVVNLDRELERLGNDLRAVVATPSPTGIRIAQPGTTPGVRRAEESLGTRQIENVKATGRRTTYTIPTGQIGNDRPIEIADERWESPELKVVVYSRFSDPRTGVVEYKLTNINRNEPPPDLFVVPPDYTIVEPGARGRGARQGGPEPQDPTASPRIGDTIVEPGAVGGRGGRGARQGGPVPQNLTEPPPGSADPRQ